MSEATASGLSAEDRKNIEAISRHFETRMREGDRAAVAELYTADGSWPLAVDMFNSDNG